MVQLSHPYMTTRKTIALTRQTFVDILLKCIEKKKKKKKKGFPGGSDHKESAFQCRKPSFDPWVRKIP